MNTICPLFFQLVLICTALESIALGWIYGISRLNQDVKQMLGTKLNYYWISCFCFFTPVLAIVFVFFLFYKLIYSIVKTKIYFAYLKSIFLISIIANTEVTLNKYRYPKWAHAIGWSTVSILLLPVFTVFLVSLFKSAKEKNLKNVNKKRELFALIFY